MKFDLESLRTLVSVDDTASMTTTAGILNISQSAVSWKLKRLQERAGVPLYRREGRSVVLTDAGRELASIGREMLALHAQAVGQFESIGLRGRVHIGATERLAGPLISDVAPWIRRNAPDIELRVRVDQPLRVLDRLASAEIDLAAVSLPEESLLESDVVLWRDQLQWTQGRDADYSEADPLPIVTFGQHCSFADLGLRHLRGAGVAHEVVLEVISHEGMRDALASGLGVALWNLSELDDRHVRCQLPVDVPEPGDVVGVVRSRPNDADTDPDPLQAAIIERIREANLGRSEAA
jgi:DNA-binding transcriptional LysR family regulator